ncbi:IclR family transcriptional regulator [Paracoccus tibetensis]|uniref:Transcriptional regulator, IclR family n=1 Tax=Paracoccus tibetensis TaxID=336292 RepID=A0A1G5BYW7_9RHOB|nr:IclR family transcriptional regulator [Paracoccus tibetensis]SCX95352.1 transcriptional regulator, IclR family [Paracoccus tibetensis]
MRAERDEVHHADPEGPSGTQSVDRAMALLDLIGRRSVEGVSLSGLVAGSGLNKATVRRLVLALIRAGMVAQDEASRLYHLGDQAQVLGAMAAQRPGLARLAGESVMRLAQEVGDAALLSVRRGASSLCLLREDGAYPIRTHALVPGQMHPLGVGAGSLALLAALPEGEREEVMAANAAHLARAFPHYAPRLPALVAETAAQGFALNPGLIFEGSWGMGVALRHPGGRLAGALSIAAVDSRMREARRPELLERLRAEAARIERKLAQVAPRQGG